MANEKSWTAEAELVQMAESYRSQEVVYGIIRGYTTRNMPVVKEGSNKMSTENTHVYQVLLPGNMIGYCQVSDFREISMNENTYQRFVGRREPFILTGIDLENRIATLSGTQALTKLKEQFWSSISNLSDEEVMNETYDAVVLNYNPSTRLVYLHLHGQLAYMYRNEWSWNERDGVDAQVGETVQVKIVLMDKERQIVRVSRKQTMADPFEFIKELKKDDIVAGKVSDIHPVHGIYVKLDNNAEVKANIIRSLERPSINDIVSCRVKNIDVENRRGRVVIIGYPNGKKRINDLGAFLYD